MSYCSHAARGRLGRSSFGLLFALFILLSASLHAQSASSLSGTISDNMAAVIPGAVVTLTSRTTGATRRFVTTDSGEYRFPQVEPGIYSLRVEKDGFAISQRDEVRLQVSSASTLDVMMEIGQVGETINVVEDVMVLNTTDATMGNAFTETQVRQLPLLTRNVVELLSLQPGVTATGEVMGGRRDQNNITLDGVDANDNQNAGVQRFGPGNGSNAGNPGDKGFNAALPVPLDSVQEFRVTTGGMLAGQGRSSGGQVSLVTKSGSNEYHGSLYEFHRNTATAANNWFSNRAGIDREALVRNQFGGSVGGRIIKDRVFFFTNIEKRIDRSAQAQTRTVPTESFKQGIVKVRDSAGTVHNLSAAQVREIDPLGIGLNPNITSLLQLYPAANDPALGVDAGLNFSGLRFNAPFTLDHLVYVGKMDFVLDKSGSHTLALRGTLADNTEDRSNALAQFPGEDAQGKLLNNSRGLSARYTGVIRPNIINTFNFGLTRLGLEQTGNLGDSFGLDSLSNLVAYSARPTQRTLPTYNLVNDVSWLKGKHNVQAGINFRIMRNQLQNYSNSFRSYSFSRNTLAGLGSDINSDVTAYLRNLTGNPALTLQSGPNTTRAFGVALGIINSMSGTYNYEKDGNALPFGTPVSREFASNEYEFYIQDQWRARPDLTLTFGLRYSNGTVPWETSGTQVGTTTGVDVYFAERLAAMESSTPGWAMPNASLTYALNGPVNNAPGWFNRDNNNLSPRFGFAWNPKAPSGSMLETVWGKTGVLRGSFALMHDRYGADLVTVFDRTGSPGLANSVTQPFNTDFTTSARYDGVNFPSLPSAPEGGYPFTPPTVLGGFNSGIGISPDLKAPYSMLINLNYGRELSGGMMMDLGYVGRLSRGTLLQRDSFQALTRFKDPASGQTWTEASGALRALIDQGVTPEMVQANPSLATPQPFFENMFAPLANSLYPGGATANYFNIAYGRFAGSELDGLNFVDREIRVDPNVGSRFPNCAVITGCNTFFALQNAGMQTWTNAGFANFHGMTLSLRRPLSRGFGWDFNYTWSHSIDNSSAVESGAGSSGAIIQDSFDYSSFRGSSDFDIRHNITGNTVVEVPFGRGKRFLGNVNPFLNQIVGGWELGVIARYNSALPTTISNAGVYPTNYLNSAVAIVKPGATVETQMGLNEAGNPSIFANRSAVNNFVGQYPGQTGTRAIIRLNSMLNFDANFAKRFFLPFEGHSLQLRGEMFNALNNVNFTNPVLRLDRASQFGEFQSAMPARVVQFAMRYEF